jgi:hypothetical protein
MYALRGSLPPRPLCAVVVLSKLLWLPELPVLAEQAEQQLRCEVCA